MTQADRAGPVAVPHLIAHRGYALHYPENTLPAIEAAIDAGAVFVEVDVQLSRDEVPFLFHDKTLKRVCDAPGALHHHPAEELLKLKASEHKRFGKKFNDVSLATLAGFAQCLAHHPGVTAFVELKRISLNRFGAARTLGLIQKDLEALIQQCVLISFDLDALLLARESGWPRVGAVIEHWRERKDKRLATLKPDYLFCDVKGLPGRGSLEFPEAQVAIYEVADANTAIKLAARGVELIETFAFSEMQRDLEARRE